MRDALLVLMFVLAALGFGARFHKPICKHVINCEAK